MQIQFVAVQLLNIDVSTETEITNELIDYDE